MDVRQAKDFLVEQTAQQAGIENVPLSDLERRMMYFTEGPDAVEDPVSLDEEFEKYYDRAGYEKKISTLLTHAYHRLRQENSSAAKQFQSATQVLQMDDHYLLVLLGPRALFRIPFSSLARLAVRVALLVLATCGAWVGIKYLREATGISAGSLFGAVFAVILLAVAIKPGAVSKLAGRGVTWLLLFLFGRRDSDSGV